MERGQGYSLSGGGRPRAAHLKLSYEWWLAICLLAGPWLLTVYCRRQLLPGPGLVGLTLLPGLATTLVLICHLHGHWHHNHPPGSEGHPFATLGVANWVTLLRGSAIVTLAGFLPISLTATGGMRGYLAWLPGSLYLLIALADLVDGFVARRSGRVSELGRTLDTATDAAGVLIAALLAVAWQRLPVAYLLVGVAYYPFTWGVWFRRRRGLPVVQLISRPYSRIIAGVHMVLAGVALVPLISPPYLALAAYLSMTPFLLGFLRDWLLVSCRLRSDSCQRTVGDHWAASLGGTVLPLLLRLALMGFMVFMTLGRAELPMTGPGPLGVVVCALLAGIGLLCRISALVLALILAIGVSPVGPGHHALLLFGIAFTLALTGSGPYTLWSPEEALLYRRPAADGQGSLDGASCQGHPGCDPQTPSNDTPYKEDHGPATSG
jgi:CDP-diacylglycerol--glycerol-3-phosphate 3-phosphatidyltransferase